VGGVSSFGGQFGVVPPINFFNTGGPFWLVFFKPAFGKVVGFTPGGEFLPPLFGAPGGVITLFVWEGGCLIKRDVLGEQGRELFNKKLFRGEKMCFFYKERGYTLGGEPHFLVKVCGVYTPGGYRGGHLDGGV